MIKIDKIFYLIFFCFVICYCFYIKNEKLNECINDFNLQLNHNVEIEQIVSKLTSDLVNARYQSGITINNEYNQNFFALKNDEWICTKTGKRFQYVLNKADGIYQYYLGEKESCLEFSRKGQL
jgi:frataxin-like iron-binding protein CyaY